MLQLLRNMANLLSASLGWKINPSTIINAETICDAKHWLREKLLGQKCGQNSPIYANCSSDVTPSQELSWDFRFGYISHPTPQSIGPSRGKTFAETTLYIARLPSRFVGDLLSSQGLMCRQESKESLSSDHSGSGPSGDSDDQWLSQVLLL